MDDLISRQDAIEALIQEFYSNVDDYISERQAVHAIEKLPSAQPERKKGKWIPYLPEGLRYKCSECESKYDTPWRFCPNCGARMRPKLQGTHFDSIIIDECAMKGADDEND